MDILNSASRTDQHRLMSIKFKIEKGTLISYHCPVEFEKFLNQFTYVEIQTLVNLVIKKDKHFFFNLYTKLKQLDGWTDGRT